VSRLVWTQVGTWSSEVESRQTVSWQLTAGKSMSRDVMRLARVGGNAI